MTDRGDQPDPDVLRYRRAKSARMFVAYIMCWHIAWVFVVLPPVSRIQGWIIEEMSEFWFSRGLAGFIVIDVRITSPSEMGSATDGVSLGISFAVIGMLVECLLGWAGFRIMVRRPRPRWQRFVPWWWRTCLYGTIAIPIMMLAASPWPDAIENPAVNIGFMAAIAGYFFFLPATLARRAIARRAYRLAQRCPACGYSLRGLHDRHCPECGHAVVKSPSGGFVLAAGATRSDSESKRGHSTFRGSP